MANENENHPSSAVPNLRAQLGANLGGIHGQHVQSVRREANVSVIVIGVDPGTRRMGVGVIRVTSYKPGRALDKLEFVRGELLEAKASWPLARRLVKLHNDLIELLDGVVVGSPFISGELSFAAIEEGFRGGRGDMSLAEARGIARCALARVVNMDVRGYAPSTVKKAVACSGHAEKAVIPRMVAALLKMNVAPQADIADALAIAITRARDKE
jgi:crossover junction endodeoxyribonuclease RuvC